MFASIFLSIAIAAEPARPARIANGADLGEQGMSYNSLPLEFPEGVATMALNINAKGKLGACRMTGWEAGGTIDPAIETLICTSLRRKARFDAATDSAGRAVDSVLEVGIDPRLPSDPTFANRDPIFTANDYPEAALRNAAAGGVTVRVAIDPGGKEQRCEVLKSSGHASLDVRTCDIYRTRAKLVPGRGPDGLPVAGSLITTVRWILPDKRPLLNSMSRTRVTFNAKGDAIECDSAWSDAAMRKESCRMLTALASKALTPVQRAFRTLSREEGLVLGPSDAADQVGKRPGENRLAMLAAVISVTRSGTVASCEAIEPADKAAVAAMCREARQMKYLPADDARIEAARTAVIYNALVLRRPGY